MTGSDDTTLILGAGPAGLTAAYLLAKLGRPVLVLEADHQVGGLSKTVVRDGYRFDLGGHRFFTKSRAVQALWEELLGDELLRRPRLSRIHWNRRYLDYPLGARDVVAKLGPLELARCAASLFFRSYTEKVWGVPTSELRAEWAAQRILSLSFASAARAALGRGDGGEKSRIR